MPTIVAAVGRRTQSPSILSAGTFGPHVLRRTAAPRRSRKDVTSRFEALGDGVHRPRGSFGPSAGVVDLDVVHGGELPERGHVPPRHLRVPPATTAATGQSHAGDLVPNAQV